MRSSAATSRVASRSNLGVVSFVSLCFVSIGACSDEAAAPGPSSAGSAGRATAGSGGADAKGGAAPTGGSGAASGVAGAGASGAAGIAGGGEGGAAGSANGGSGGSNDPGGAGGQAAGSAGAPGKAGSGGGAGQTSAGAGGAPFGGAAGAAASAGAAGASGAPVNVTGIDLVATGEYVTSYLHQGRLYGLAGTLYRLGAGDTWPKTTFPPAEVAFPPDVKIVKAVGGLHVTLALSSDGRVWEWGDIPANPDLAKSNVPVHIAVDAAGNPFDARGPGGQAPRWLVASTDASLLVKGDGTVWIWDDCSQGRQGDGTDGSATRTKPIQVKIPLPTGVGITKVVMAGVVHALASDGSVWSWGSKGVLENLGTDDPDYRSPHKIEKTSTGDAFPPIADIATGNGFSYAVAKDGSLYAWGQLGNVAGLCDGYCPAKRPVLAQQVIANIPKTAKIASIYANSHASYVILTDGTLWAWGSNGQGLVGNGVSPDYAKTTPPYTWDWSKDSLLQRTAVRIAPTIANFTTLYTGTALVMYAYAQTADGRLFSWGRNKTANLGSGVYPLNSHQAATYPNSWDVDEPTEVFPLKATDKPTSSPLCTQKPETPNCWCGKGPSDPQGC